jgi:hypothetical protein
MTWAEFCLRHFSYRRQNLEDWQKVREIAWNSLIGSHYNPKKLPKSIRAFMPLEGSGRNTANEKMKTRMLEVTQQYIKQKQNGS